MDTLKMMGATTDEQFDLTISAIERSGRAFEDMTIQNFSSVNEISKFIERLKAINSADND